MANHPESSIHVIKGHFPSVQQPEGINSSSIRGSPEDVEGGLRRECPAERLPFRVFRRRRIVHVRRTLGNCCTFHGGLLRFIAGKMVNGGLVDFPLPRFGCPASLL